MIIDTSAIIAILIGEPERASFIERIQGTEPARMSTASYVEASIVVDRIGDPVLSRRLDELLHALGVELVELSPAQARIARGAYRDFGRGSGHPAGLNFGDCFAYALAQDQRAPLLFKGDDFVHTDVHPAT